MQPTLMHVGDNAMRNMPRRNFGPFGVIQTFDSANQAWALANDTSFGLVSYVWSENLSTIMDAQKRLESGLLWVNTPMVRELRAPFGGVKDPESAEVAKPASSSTRRGENRHPAGSKLLTKLAILTHQVHNLLNSKTGRAVSAKIMKFSTKISVSQESLRHIEKFVTAHFLATAS